MIDEEKTIERLDVRIREMEHEIARQRKNMGG